MSPYIFFFNSCGFGYFLRERLRLIFWASMEGAIHVEGTTQSITSLTSPQARRFVRFDMQGLIVCLSPLLRDLASPRLQRFP
jgi:hypothetical protein